MLTARAFDLCERSGRSHAGGKRRLDEGQGPRMTESTAVLRSVDVKMFGKKGHGLNAYHSAQQQ